MSEEENISPEEKNALKDYLGFGAPIPEEKHNVHSFLYKVATSDDTTKTGNLTIEELGLPKINLRTHKELALIADKIMDNPFLRDYYAAKGEITTATSLSKDAKLINLAVMQKRQIEDVTKPERKPNSGWFKKKSGDINQQGDNS